MHDHAQNVRLNQKSASDTPGVLLSTQETMPQQAYRGQLIFLLDIDEFRVFDGVAWVAPSVNPDTSGARTFVGAEAPLVHELGDLWMRTTDYVLLVWDGTVWQEVQDPTAEAAALSASQAQADALAALQAAQDAQATADGKITTFYDPTAPTTGVIGDLWINTATDRLYRHNGAAQDYWVEIQDVAIAQAIADAGTAQATADLKIETYYTTLAPTGLGPEDIGDLWFDQANNNMAYRWDGAGWVSIRDAGISAAAATADAAYTLADDAMTAAQMAQATADGVVNTYYASDPPWPNGDTTQPPENDGDMWYDSDTGQSFRWIAPNWVEIVSSDVQQALDAAAEAQATADGKISAFYSTTAPAAPSIGDIWYNTAQGNLASYWDGVGWVFLKAGAAAVQDTAMDYKTLTGVKVRTSPSGNRVEMTDNDAGTGWIAFYTGQAGEYSPGYVYSSSGSGYGTLTVQAPNFGDTPSLYMYSSAGSSYTQLTADEIRIQGNLMLNGAHITPAGSVVMWTGNSAPAGWAFCFGQAMYTTSYPDLFNVIGYSYGGSGSIFYLPDMRARIPVGVDTSGQTVFWLGASDGRSSLLARSDSFSHQVVSGTIPLYGGGSGSGSTNNGGQHSHGFNGTTNGPSGTVYSAQGTGRQSGGPNHTHNFSGPTDLNGLHSHSFSYSIPAPTHGNFIGIKNTQTSAHSWTTFHYIIKLYK